jgi:pseudouridine synthase
MQERIQKLMAQANIGSRRACEDLIQQNRVLVNGKIAQLGDKADPEKDVIIVDGERLKLDARRLRYFVVNKPRYMLSTTEKEEGDDRPTVRDSIPTDEHLFMIGRLDVDSEGMMILTNDGELANRLSHPRYEHTKTYKVTVDGHPSEATLQQWERGVWLDGSKTAPCYIKVMEKQTNHTILRLVMIEGRKRQIRRIALMLGHPVKRLLRTHIGQLGIGTLEKGAWYELSQKEVDIMKLPASEVQYLRRRNRRPRPNLEADHTPLIERATGVNRNPKAGVIAPIPARPSSKRKSADGADFITEGRPTNKKRPTDKKRPIGKKRPSDKSRSSGDSRSGGKSRPSGKIRVRKTPKRPA